MIVYFGKAPTPWSAKWSLETHYSVGRCEWFAAPAIVQNQAHGQGEPLFREPNINRQRKLHALELCDLCARPLRGRSRYSLSRFVGVELREGQPLTQFEPMIHGDCAKSALQACPHLRGQMDRNVLQVRLVYRSEPVATPAMPEDIASFVPGYSGPSLVGQGATILHDWKDVTADFRRKLGGGQADLSVGKRASGF